MSVEVESERDYSPVQDSLQIVTQDEDLEKWRNKVRTQVTSLKCHIMASRGLTPDGKIIEPYSPDILLEKKALGSSDTSEDEIDTYIQVAMAKLTNKKSSQTDTNAVDIDDVQFSIDLENDLIDSSDLQLNCDSLSNNFGNIELPLNDSTEDSLKECIKKNSQDSIDKSPIKCSQDSTDESALKDNKVDLSSFYVEQMDGKDYELLKEELLKRSREVEKLSTIRDEVENELQELTANLFQEAHGMVLGANQRAAAAEKALKEANMQVEVLQAEVAALKTLVLTSTPSAPNPHLHPHIISKGAQAIVEAGKMFQRGHKKSPSDFDLKYGRDTTPPSSPLKESQLMNSGTGGTNGFPLDPECWEVDPVLHREFVAWRQDPSLSRDDPFMSRVYTEDIDLCLTFPNSILAHKVQVAIEDNALYIEEVNPRQKNSCPKKCVLLDVPRYCKYRFRLGETDETWYYISQLARNRIIGVCDFLNYLRYIQLGLVKSSIHDVYWEIVKRRKQMALARLGF